MQPRELESGVLMLDLEGLALGILERDLLLSAQVGGVILFSRNYASPQQLSDLVASIKQCNERLLVAVDQEGGQVQRFRECFLPLPSLRTIGAVYQQESRQGLEAARLCAWAMAAELLQFGIDISFAPVLDLFSASSPVIKHRAFSPNAAQVSDLGLAYIAGMHQAGMAATGKHFPGHGNVMVDSHTELPTDRRSMDEIRASDMQPFAACVGALDAIMPAHIVYPAVDQYCAGFSKIWIRSVLREELAFNGVVFSDDLTMNAAHSAGTISQRAKLALAAGCDMVLVCNNPKQARELVDSLDKQDQTGNARIGQMLAKPELIQSNLYESEKWHEAEHLIASLSA